jgi:hypothetical protein
VSRADLFARIRDEAADRDLVTRLAAAQFSVDHATVTRALTGQDPPPAKRHQSQRNPILEDLRHHIDEMIAASPDALGRKNTQLRQVVQQRPQRLQRPVLDIARSTPLPEITLEHRAA